MRPRNLSPSITIATRPRSKTSSKSLNLAFGGRVSSRSVIAFLTGSLKCVASRCTFTSTSDSSRIPIARPLIDHGQLRNVSVAHPFESGEQGIGWSDRNDFAGFISMRNQIVQIAVRRPVNESLLCHPEIVVHLGKIFVPGVSHETDDTFRLALLPAVTQRARDQRSSR